MQPLCTSRRGFTLVEVMVALAVVAIALLAAFRAVGQGTSGSAELRSRMLAGWVAENLLAEQRARGDWLPVGTQRGSVLQAGAAFTWREEITATPNPAFRRVDVYVYSQAEQTRPLVRLTGFSVLPRTGE